jgi:hypothetical protein
MLTSALDVDEIDVVSSCVDSRPKSHRICDLLVEPEAFIYRKEYAQNWAQNTEAVAQHRQKDEPAIICQNEASTTRNPDGKLERVKGSKSFVGLLQRAKMSYLDRFQR